MLVRVELISPTKNYIRIKNKAGESQQLPRSGYRYLRVGDICDLIQVNGKFKLIPLTDEDDIVIMNHPDRKRMVPFGFFGPFPMPP